MDCDKLRAMVIGLPACCAFCHAEGHLQRVKFDGERLRICCTLVAEVIGLLGGSVDPDWTADGPFAPRFAASA